MAKGILLRATGGPEVLEWGEIDVPVPRRNEVRVRHTAIGVNYIDVYGRTGLYPMTLPGSLGQEAAGVVEAVGRGVTAFAPGDRVAYVLATPGSYVEARNVPADRLVRVPDSITDEQAAAMMLKGMTAQYLLRRTYRVKKGDPVVIHAAAGGVGLIATQWARHLGAHVVGVVGSEAKAQLAREHGAHETIVAAGEPIAPRVRALTKGKGAAVVYDATGKDTFFDSLDSLRPLGLMVSYGNASGPVPPFGALELGKRGSLFLTRPSLFHYIASKGDLARSARELFAVVAAGHVRIRVGQAYPLAEAARAHRDLEARRTTGSTVLRP
ncbi:MAG: quinone oxidoreductase [Steroidobacteraceae bacterium]|jgi:NADPH2:quinone reductase|nr:quinone oxidoreductase [Steroidobacteraceae bacterium]